MPSTTNEDENMRQDRITVYFKETKDATGLALAKAFNNPEYSDLFIKCQETTFACHRVILCNRLPFFEAACRLEMKEKASNTIEFEEEEPATVEALLRFLYTGKLHNQLGSMKPEEVAANVFSGAKLYALGEKLEVPDLKNAVLSRVLRPSIPEMEMKEFPTLVQIVYSSTPELDRELRNLILDNAVERKDQWDTAFRIALFDYPDFAADLVMLRLKDYEDRYFCSMCDGCDSAMDPEDVLCPSCAAA